MALAVVALCMLATPALAEPPSARDIDKLIAELASEDFGAREAAADELTSIGLPALAALEIAAAQPGLEQRIRSRRIAGLIREQDLKRRLDAFLSGQDKADDYPLPGWTRFKKSYGDDNQTRALFVEMLRADPNLLGAIEAGPRPAAEAVAQQAAQLQQSLQFGIQQQLSAGQLAACLFVAAEADVALSSTAMSLLYSQCQQPPHRDVIVSGGRGGLPRKMLGSIVRRSDDATAYMAMQLSNQLNLPEGIVPALKILDNKTTVRSSYYTATALVTVARTKDKAHLPLVESLLKDNKTVSQTQINGGALIQLQVRDAALAAAILLSDQELKDYFDFTGKSQPTDPQSILLNPTLIGFKADDDRAAVFKKWEVYQARRAAEGGGRAANAAPASP